MGYTGVDSGTFISYDAGKYKTSTGNALCSVCAAGTYSGEVGATSNLCINCPIDSNSNDTSITKTNCICNAGSSSPDGGPCVKCVAGKYKVEPGPSEGTLCEIRKYSTEIGAITSSTCESCHQNSSSVAGSIALTNCTCDAGFSPGQYLFENVCVACPVGTFKNISGNSSRENCNTGMYSITVDAVSTISCVNCVQGKYSTTSAAGHKLYFLWTRKILPHITCYLSYKLSGLCTREIRNNFRSQFGPKLYFV